MIHPNLTWLYLGLSYHFCPEKECPAGGKPSWHFELTGRLKKTIDERIKDWVNRGIAYYQFVDGKNNKCELIKRNNKKRKKTTNWLRSPKKYFNKTSEKAQKKKKGLGTENHVTKAESETNIDQQPPSCSSWVELLLLLHLNPHSSKVHDFSHSDLILVFFSFLVILVLTPLRLFGNPFNFRFYLEPIDSSTRLRSLYLLRSLRFSLHAND